MSAEEKLTRKQLFKKLILDKKIDIERAGEILTYIPRFNGYIENDEFDMKEADKEPANLVACIQAFLNGKKESGYVIVGIEEKDDEKFNIENAKPVNRDFLLKLSKKK